MGVFGSEFHVAIEKMRPAGEKQLVITVAFSAFIKTGMKRLRSVGRKKFG